MATAKKTAGKGKDPRQSKAGSSDASKKAKEATTQTTAPSGGTTTETHVHDTALSAPTDVKLARRKLASADDAVTVRIPRAFNLQVLDSHGSRMVRYEAGTDEMPRSHAEHDYSIANGVEIVTE